MNTGNEFNDELAAHLAGQQHPMPCPPKFDHGYIRVNADEIPALHRKKHPGPITMHEPPKPRIKWASLCIWIAWASFWGTVAYNAFNGFSQ